MTDRPLPERIPAEWAERWAEPARGAGFWPVPDLLLDDPLPATPRRAEIERTNRGRAESLRQLTAPALILVALGILGTFPTFFDLFVG